MILMGTFVETTNSPNQARLRQSNQYDLDSHAIKRIIEEGQRYKEGKTKTRYALRTKHETLVAICSECPDQITIITITKGR